MAAPSYKTDLLLIDDGDGGGTWAESTASGWTSVFAVTLGETDDFIQGAACNSTTVKTGVGVLLVDFGSGITIPTDGAIFIWMKWDVSVSLDIEAQGGVRTVSGSALNAFQAYSHLGSDTYIYGGWKNLAQGDPAALPTADFTAGSPSGTQQFFGWAFNAVSVPSKGNPYKVDCIRYGRGIAKIVDGDSSTPGTLTGLAQENDYNDGTNGFNRWGLFQQETPSSFLWKGLLSFGGTDSACYVDDNSKSITIDNTKKVTKAFNRVELNNASTTVRLTAVTFNSLGTVSPGQWVTNDNAQAILNGCSFSNMDTFDFDSASSYLDCTFRACGVINHGGADLSGSIINSSAVGVDSSALVYSSITDPSGKMDNMSFSRGNTPNHAIQFDSATPASMTINGVDFTGYGSANDSDDSVFHFKNSTVAANITLNLVGCSTDGAFSYRTDGASITIVEDPVTLTVNTITTDGSAIGSARVFVAPVDSSGPLPYRESVTITRSGTTATVAHTAHGLSTGEKFLIQGADSDEYNGIQTIGSVPTGNSYTYTVPSTMLTPAPGGILSTAVIISGLSNGSGVATNTRTYSAPQTITGWARKGSASPYYKTGAIVGTISNTLGLTTNAVMVLDE